MTQWIDSPEFRLFHIPGRNMVAPRFWKKLAYFYVSSQDMTKAPKLLGYQWNDLTYEFELKCSKDLTTETSQDNYHKFSFVSVGDDGVILGQWGASAGTGDFKVYKCAADVSGAWSFSENAVSFDNSANAEVGDTAGTHTITKTKLTLVQAREDPDSYDDSTGTVTVPQIYGLHMNGYILKFTWSANTLTATPSITVPTNLKIVMSPEWVDVGKNYIGVLQPV